MFPRPRYHAQKRWARGRESEIRAAAMTIARLIATDTGHGEWSGGSWNRQPRRWMPRSGSGRFDGPYRRAFPRRYEPQQGRPWSHNHPRWPGTWKQEAQGASTQDWRSRVLPMRGPPVASIPAPRCHRQESWETRQPRGRQPRGPPLGGPERPVDDPWRNPQGGPCGGTERSAEDTRSQKPTHDKVNGSRPEKRNRMERKRPTIITIDKSGQEREWGPLSQSNAWRVGSFRKKMGRTVTVFLEKDGTRKEVEVTKRIEGGIEKVWLKEKDAQPQQEERKENHEPTLEDDERTQEEDDEPTPEDVGI